MLPLIRILPAALLVLVGCAGEAAISEGYEFRTSDPELGAALQRGADELTDNGVDVGSLITVTEQGSGIEVRRATRLELEQYQCDDGDGHTLGCALRNTDGQYRLILIADDQQDEQLFAAVFHEMLHTVVGSRHLPEGEVGVLAETKPMAKAPSADTYTLTDADRRLVCEHTSCAPEVE